MSTSVPGGGGAPVAPSRCAITRDGIERLSAISTPGANCLTAAVNRCLFMLHLTPAKEFTEIVRRQLRGRKRRRIPCRKDSCVRLRHAEHAPVFSGGQIGEALEGRREVGLAGEAGSQRHGREGASDEESSRHANSMRRWRTY